MKKRLTVLLLLMLALFAVIGCDDNNGDSPGNSPGGSFGPGMGPPGIPSVYGYVFLGDNIGRVSGVRIFLSDGTNNYQTITSWSDRYYQFQGVVPGIYNVSLDFSYSNLEDLLDPPPSGYFFDWANSQGSHFGFYPAGKYPGISGTVKDVPIDSSSNQFLWFFIVPAQSGQE